MTAGVAVTAGWRGCGRADAGQEQAGRTEAVTPGGCWLAVAGSGREGPAGPGEERFGLGGLERGPGRLPQRGHHGLEAGAGRVAARPGQGHADGQAAAGRGDLPELPEHVFQDGRLQVDGDPFEQEQARRVRVEPGRAQPADWVAGEVDLDEPHVGRVEAEPFERSSLSRWVAGWSTSNQRTPGLAYRNARPS